MKKISLLCLTAIILTATTFAQKTPDNFVLIEGGIWKNTKPADDHAVKSAVVPNFYIGKYEVTQKEWSDIMESNPAQFKGDNLPVETVSWYDSIEYCNKRSIKDGLQAYYNIDKTKKDPDNKCDLDDVKWIVTINADANGYRLPTETEWQYAASGGRKGMGYTYSGSNDMEKVAWYWRNSGDKFLNDLWKWSRLESNHCKSKPVGSKEPNELGLYDMSGNVREWCLEWYVDKDIKSGNVRTQKGGCWMGVEECCELSFRGGFEANGKGPDQGLRLCRSK